MFYSYIYVLFTIGQQHLHLHGVQTPSTSLYVIILLELFMHDIIMKIMAKPAVHQPAVQLMALYQPILITVYYASVLQD